jgi:hypothetical protein
MRVNQGLDGEPVEVSNAVDDYRDVFEFLLAERTPP